MNLSNLSQDDKALGGLGLLLAIDLLFLPWFHVSVGPFSASTSATGAPDGWLAVLAVLATLAVVADLAIERFSPQTQLPTIGAGREGTRFILAAVAAAFVALKFLFHIHFGSFGYGFYVGVLLTIGFVVVARRAASAPAVGGSPVV